MELVGGPHDGRVMEIPDSTPLVTMTQFTVWSTYKNSRDTEGEAEVTSTEIIWKRRPGRLLNPHPYDFVP